MSKIDTEFQKYIGAKVLVDEGVSEVKLFGKMEKFPTYEINKNDTIVAEIKNQYKDGRVRVWLPNTMGTMDVKNNRLNVRIAKVGDSFEITRVYFG